MLRSYPSGETDLSHRPRPARATPSSPSSTPLPYVLCTRPQRSLPLALGWLHSDLLGVFLLAGVLRLVVSHRFTFPDQLRRPCLRPPALQRREQRARQRLARASSPMARATTTSITSSPTTTATASAGGNGTEQWIICSLSWVGLTTKLHRTPDVAIQRARLDMQFRRVKDSLKHKRESLPHVDLERLREPSPTNTSNSPRPSRSGRG